ncbi:MAG: flagellar hook-length control protein FliK [Spirochaetia bacterium]
MYFAAPQAPVSQDGKNRKTPGTSHSAALERGPNKGSALFQQLMDARAAPRFSGAKSAPKAEGLKGEYLLAALLKASLSRAPKGKLPAFLPVDGDAGAVSAQDKREMARKAARAKMLAETSRAGQVALLLEARHVTGSTGKEPKEGRGEPAKAPLIEARAAASRAAPLVRIVDLRHAEKPHAAAENAARPAGVFFATDRDAATPVALRLGTERAPFADNLPKPVSPAPHAQTPLERLREMAGAELVRATSLVLKDGGGEIRLVLKPESLGSVRIRMNVVDNSIEGRIIVDSAQVKHVFDGSVDALRRALTAEGFQTGSLQVSVGGQNPESGDRRQQEQASAEVRRITAQGFERNVPGVENVSLGDLFVNLFV